MYNLECELRKVIKKSDPINYENKLTIYGTTSTVNYENIESFYILSSGDIICPRGKFHAYNNNDYTKTQFISADFEDNGNWDLKCYYHNSGYFLVFYLMNGQKNYFTSRNN